MKAEKQDLQRRSEDRGREPADDVRYVADWHRKSKKDIVKEGISALGDNLRKAATSDQSIKY